MRSNLQFLRGSALPHPLVDLGDGGGYSGRHVLVVDDGSELVPHLLSSLQRAGALPLLLQTVPVERHVPTIVAAESDVAVVERTIDRLHEVAGGLAGILVLHTRPLDASRLNDALSTLYRAIAIARACGGHTMEFLYVVTAQGGRFGLDRCDSVDMVAPALEALCHPLRLELPRVSIRSIDLDPADGPERHAEQVRREIGQPDEPPLTSYGWRGERTVWGIEEVEASPRDGALDEQSVVLFAGGARGIGAVCACHLSCRLVFTGRTPLTADAEALAVLPVEQRPEWMSRFVAEYQATHPTAPPRAPRDAWRRLEQAAEACQTLAAVQAAGREAEYLVADVRDGQAVEEVVRNVKERYGRLDLIVHVAGLGGVETDRLLSRKEWPAMEQLIETKTRGAAHLLRAAERYEVPLFIGFGSVASRFGNAGQVDYAAANGLLSGIVRAHNARGNPPFARVIHWGAWDGVGMAVSGPTKAVLAEQGVGFISPDEGAAAFLGQVLLGARAPAELTISAPWPGLDELTARNQGRQRPEQPHVGTVVELSPGESLLAERCLTPRDSPLVDHHRYQGTAWLPTVMGLELAVEAAASLCPDRTPYAVRRLVLKKAVRFIRDEPVMVRTRARRLAGRIEDDVAVHAVISAQAGKQEWTFAEMDVFLSTDRSESARELPPGDDLWTEPVHSGDGVILSRSDLYPSDSLRFQHHGSTFQVLDELVIHAGERLAYGHMTAQPAGGPITLPLQLIDGLLQAYGVTLSREMGRWCGPPLTIEELCWLPCAAGAVSDLRFDLRWDASDPTRFPIWHGYDQNGVQVLRMTGCACGGTGVKDLGERLPGRAKAPIAPPPDVGFPYLGEILDEVRGRRMRIAQILQPREEALLRDHQFNRYVIVPAVYYMELAAEVAEWLVGEGSARELRGFHFRQAFSLVSEPKTMIVEAEVEDDGEVAVRYFSRRGDALTLHAEGKVLCGNFSPLGKLPPLPGGAERVVTRDELYPHRFPNGPIFQVIESMRLTVNHTSHATLRVRERPRSGCRLPITLLDGAFQVDSATRSGLDRPSGLPQAFSSLRWTPEIARADAVECFSATGDSSTESPGRLVFTDKGALRPQGGAAAILLRLDGITLTPAFSSLWSP